MKTVGASWIGSSADECGGRAGKGNSVRLLSGRISWSAAAYIGLSKMIVSEGPSRVVQCCCLVYVRGGRTETKTMPRCRLVCPLRVDEPREYVSRRLFKSFYQISRKHREGHRLTK